MNQISAIEADVARTAAVLGGQAVLGFDPHTGLEAHDLLARGIPRRALLHLAAQSPLWGAGDAVEKAFGISLRTLQRHKSDAKQANLNTEQSNRAWKFAEILGRAREVFGSNAAAEAWLTSPAMGLDYRKPIDLLATSVGVDAVESYLTRIEYGVYA